MLLNDIIIMIIQFLATSDLQFFNVSYYHRVEKYTYRAAEEPLTLKNNIVYMSFNDMIRQLALLEQGKSNGGIA